MQASQSINDQSYGCIEGTSYTLYLYSTCKELDRESSHFDDFCSTLFLCRFDNNNKQKEKK